VLEAERVSIDFGEKRAGTMKKRSTIKCDRLFTVHNAASATRVVERSSAEGQIF
jgi:hypothetical protein